MRKLLGIFAALTLTAGFVVGPAQSAGAADPRPEFVTGTGDGSAATVATYDATGQALSQFTAFNGATGARVASGDVNGDITSDIVVGTGRGVPSQVAVYSMSGFPMGTFSPYGAGFTGGVNVGVGDVDGDTIDEIVTAAGPGGGPHVIVWDWANGVATAKYGWYAYDAGFRGGVNLSVADIVNSAKDDVVTAPGAGGGPHVRVWDLGGGTAVEDAAWFAYAPSFAGGVRVGAGEIDGSPAVVTGAGPGGGPHVRLFSTHGAFKSEFFAYAANYTGGVNVILSTAQGGDLGHVITAPASWGGPHVRAFTSNGAELWGVMAYGGATMNGVTLGAIPQLGTNNNTNQNGGTNSSVDE
ncbi:MAG: hypothetical protein QOI61_1534 [Actinomycetota bacterium]